SFIRHDRCRQDCKRRVLGSADLYFPYQRIPAFNYILLHFAPRLYDFILCSVPFAVRGYYIPCTWERQNREAAFTFHAVDCRYNSREAGRTVSSVRTGLLAQLLYHRTSDCKIVFSLLPMLSLGQMIILVPVPFICQVFFYSFPPHSARFRSSLLYGIRLHIP